MRQDRGQRAIGVYAVAVTSTAQKLASATPSRVWGQLLVGAPARALLDAEVWCGEHDADRRLTEVELERDDASGGRRSVGRRTATVAAEPATRPAAGPKQAGPAAPDRVDTMSSKACWVGCRGGVLSGLDNPVQVLAGDIASALKDRMLRRGPDCIRRLDLDLPRFDPRCRVRVRRRSPGAVTGPIDRMLPSLRRRRSTDSILPMTSRKAFVQRVPPRLVLAAHVGGDVQPVRS